MIASIADRILALHGWGALLVVFGLPALESSAFVGFLFPGEIAVLLGGVLAYQHQVSLPAVLAAAVAGAIVGDTVGYEIGKHHGRRILQGSIGRILRHEHLDRAERYLAERGGKAVFFGRFTAALRVMIPGLAGMAHLRYRTFLAWNAAGGALWATAFVLAGYAAGSSWRRVEHIAGRASVVLLLLAVLVAAITAGARWASANHERLRSPVERLVARPIVTRLRSKYARQLGFVGRRIRPRERRGLSLTVGLGVLILTGWLFGAITQDVIGGDEAARVDRPALAWFVHHREPWLTRIAEVVTALGSSIVIVPAAVLVGLLLWRARRTLRPMLFLSVTCVGAELLSHAIKRLTDRARPPDPLAVHHFSGLAFPSGHATLATAMWGAIALTLASLARTWPRQVALIAVAVAIAATVGLTRLYLGAHWLTDVLGGWTLGAAWLSVATVATGPTAPTRSRR